MSITPTATTEDAQAIVDAIDRAATALLEIAAYLAALSAPERQDNAKRRAVLVRERDAIIARVYAAQDAKDDKAEADALTELGALYAAHPDLVIELRTA